MGLRIPVSILVATAVSTVVFAATPFLIPAIAEDQGVPIGRVGLISTTQLAGFVVASWGGPRWLRPRRRVLVSASLIGALASVASGLAPSFALLLAARAVSGVSLGLIAWISWVEVFGDSKRVGDIAVIGPIVGTIASPILAVLIDRSGPDVLYYALAVLHLVPLCFIRSTRLAAASRPRHDRHRPTRAAAAILMCLGMLTLGGSAVFIFAGAIGEDIGLTPFAISLAFAANSIAGVPSAKFRGSRRGAGLWMGVTALAAIAIGVVDQPIVFWIALPVWGFAFWMGIPGTFELLAERSRFPDERAGDAQAVMAAGRVIGPIVGGVAYAASPVMLSIVGGGLMLAASGALVYVEWRIRPMVLTQLLRLS